MEWKSGKAISTADASKETPKAAGRSGFLLFPILIEAVDDGRRVIIAAIDHFTQVVHSKLRQAIIGLLSVLYRQFPSENALKCNEISEILGIYYTVHVGIVR